MKLRFVTVLLIVAGIPVVLPAQQNTTIQLPTFNMTTASTSISVPDGGTGLLGGINRASEGSVSRGVPMLGNLPYLGRFFKNRGIGRDVSASNMTVVPRIIILEEEEFRQTGITADSITPPATGAFGGSAVDPQVAGKADFISRNVARYDSASRRAVDPALPAIDEVRRQNELAAATRSSEADRFFAKGQQAESEGKSGVAKIYYQMAARRANADLKDKVATRLAVLGAASSR